jgi:Gluconate 2-dehydrogenase subunit 3
MSNDVRDLPRVPDAGDGPLRHFRIGRRAVLQSLATGVGAAVFASPASSASSHAHHAGAAVAALADPPTATGGASALLFLDQHSFDTLALLSEQIVPGSRAAQVSEFLDRLLAVESTDTQKRFTQALGTFEREARETHGTPWKSLTAPQATALLTKISTLPDSDTTRAAFENIKGAVAETYFSTEAGMKELGWNGSVTFAPPSACT